jgi:ankyrin repeat protein
MKIFEMETGYPSLLRWIVKCIPRKYSGALDEASRQGQIECLRFLLDSEIYGSDILSVIDHASSSGQLETFQYLFEKGLYPNNLGRSLHKICVGGYIHILRYLLSQQVVISNDQLEIASWCDDFEMVSLIYDQGTVSDVGKNEALCAACRDGYLDIIRLLVDRGVPVNGAEIELQALAQAAEFNRPEVVSLLLDFGADISVLETLESLPDDVWKTLRNRK